jgi:hypothetical protein
MNDNSSRNSPTSASHPGLTAEAISQRAYELWEKEGRPENRDLHHWLRAEQELIGNQSGATSSSQTDDASARNESGNSDTRPLQGTRASAAANREPRSAPKRASANPFGTEKSSGTRSTQAGTRAGRS